MRRSGARPTRARCGRFIWNLRQTDCGPCPTGAGFASGRGTTRDAAGVLVVQDEGVGIPESELDAIFQPFHGAFEKGSGLGMAIVHRIVNDYGRRDPRGSKPGAGTTVEVRLPAREAAAA